jgi:hypothetical protein
LKFVGIYFTGLKWSLNIFRKSQEASAFNFDHEGENSTIFYKGGLARPHPGAMAISISTTEGGKQNGSTDS